MSFSVGSSGGGSKGSSESTQKSPYAQALADLSLGFAEESKGLRTGLIDTLYEALMTGGTNIPIIGQAVEAGKKAASDTMTQTETGLNQSGLGGTPFAQAILASTRDQGNFATSQIEPQIVQALINMIPNLVIGQGQSALSGLGAAMAGNTTTTGSQKIWGYQGAK